jgi:GNAT superfamily N-acetyltransferase
MNETSHSISVRLAGPEDTPFLVEGNRIMAWETEHHALDPAILSAGVAAVFQDTRCGFYLIAELDGKPVGQLMVTYEWSDWRNGWIWWIQSVHVIESARRQGVFSTLFQSVEDGARAQGNVRGFRLYVERDNQIAQATYQKLGMLETAYHVREKLTAGD